MTPKKYDEERSYIQIWNVPSELKQKFKAACALSGKGMRETFIGMMKDFVKNAESKKSRRK